MRFLAVVGFVVGFITSSFGEENITLRANYDPTACNRCSADLCTILPPDSTSSFPCYQGNNADTKTCFNTDPLLPDGAKWVCGACADFGYPTYLQNDPIYKNMELWVN
jgi:hypothetical protein